MDKHLPQKHQAHATPGTNGAGPPEEDGMEQASETLMEALSERISFDPENGSIEGCENDFRITQEVLQRHNQQEVAE
ncbi:MAG TPA: hypothetical protein VM536_21325 [Chloroflexia bacterium]|nr:hypothetical protein [Chloroflexia bacterium]